MKYLTFSILIFCLFSNSLLAQSVMSSDEYKIQSDSLNFGGRLGSSTNYIMEDTLGESGSGQIDSTTYKDYLGYQFMLFADPDTTDPSAPASLTAQVVSSSEIELSWSESTDNIAVDRYYIYRDGVRIDDVSIFPRDFNDTGLSPSTSYSYNVSAVDDSGNESLWSGTTTAVTLSSSVTSQGGRSVAISNFLISSNDNNANVFFNTSVPRYAQVDWGRDLTYTDGTVESGVYDTTHNVLLSNLTPNTTYFLRVYVKDVFGNPVVFENIQFKTLNVPISKNPSNALSFKAIPQENSIDLSWILPNDNRVIGARIVRSTESYPSSPNDGEVVFEYRDASRIESFIDKNVEKGVTYYYAIFTEDLAGNFSSGAIIASKILGLSGEVFENPLDKLLPAGYVHPAIEKLQIKDFLFIQSGDSVDVSGNKVFIYGDKNTTIALKYYRVPPVLKTIAVSVITKGENPERFTFILRPNKDKTRYEATIGPLGDPKLYDIKIDILDFKNQGLKTLDGTLEVSPSQTPSFYKNFFANKQLIVFVVSAFVLVMIIFLSLFFRNLRRDKLSLVNTTAKAT